MPSICFTFLWSRVKTIAEEMPNWYSVLVFKISNAISWLGLPSVVTAGEAWLGLFGLNGLFSGATLLKPLIGDGDKEGGESEHGEEAGDEQELEEGEGDEEDLLAFLLGFQRCFLTGETSSSAGL